MNESRQSTSIPPVYTRLKDLHLTTELVKQGRPNVTIVTPISGVYDGQASQIQEAVEKLSSVRVPIVTDGSPAGAVPIAGNLILLGNRSTHRTIEELYNRYYTLLDLWYPGPEGYEVRSLHNPFGDGYNVIFVGGSDAVGVAKATEAFVEKLAQAEVGKETLSVGWLMEIQLGKGMRVPKDLKDFEIWEASAGYGSVGYFGWNSISKRMAMYYMTGDPFHAWEAIRLSFPDERAFKEMAQIDEERIENKDEPLSGPYHYNAHMLILYWDLIEESPVFTDEERLRVTNAFSKQFMHDPYGQGGTRRILDNLNKGEDAYAEPPPHVGDRHNQWAAIALYCLGRYFQKDYPHPLWQHSLYATRWHFASLHRHAWVIGEHDNLFWYSTSLAPILPYMLLTGDRRPLENGVLSRLLRGQEILLSGCDRDRMLTSSAISFLRQAAYLTQDGRYLEYLRRTGMDLSVFRLGQSFAPEAHLKPALPSDLAGKWSIHPLPEPMWRARASGLPMEESFQFGSFRSAPDASGDFILIKGLCALYSGGGSRNPYHTFAILELRLAGQTVLDGFWNQILTKEDGTVEPQVGMDAALRLQDVIGQTAVAVGEVPNAAFCNWRRTLVQRDSRYALIVDNLKFRADSENMQVEVLWQGKGTWQAIPGKGTVRIEGAGRTFEIRLSDPVETAAEDGRAKMTWRSSVRDGEEKTFFSLIAGASDRPLVCARLGDNAVILALPGPALAVAGEWEGLQGDLVVLAQDHLHGVGLTGAVLDTPLFSADVPVHVDWDFERGVLEVVAGRDTQIRLALTDGLGLRMDGEVSDAGRGSDGLATLRVSAGRHTFSGARPDPEAITQVVGRLEVLLGRGREEQRRIVEAAGPSPRPDAPPLSTVFTAEVGGKVVDLVVIASEEGAWVCAVEGQTVHVFAPDGKEARRLATDGPIRVLRWWPEHRLLLAGCADEKVIAFDEAGERRWTFTSEMDPEVFRAAKQYWFKSAPGHEGVHGLHTGVFLNGESQAFVGSACTLEILDESGDLINRLPVFWGPGSKFALINGPEGSINLLIARQPADYHNLVVINNRTLDSKSRSFHSVPPGHTNIGVWGCMFRKHIFYDDLDGDGAKEVVSEINGAWNRVTVWASDGTPLYNVNLGPGEYVAPTQLYERQNVRDLDIADLDGDGKKEILAATSDGLVIALDHQCRKVWARRLPSPPTVLACVRSNGAPRIAVGCEDGTLVALNGQGGVTGVGRTRGRPTCIEVLGEVVIAATDEGEVKGRRCP